MRKKTRPSLNIIGFLSDVSNRSVNYYIPPCPVCGSCCTGRYVKKPVMDASFVEEESLKHAEIIRFCSSEPVKNAFCVDCGHTWGCTPKSRFVSSDELVHEEELRGTREAYEEIRRMNRESRDAKKRSAGRRVLGFFTES